MEPRRQQEGDEKVAHSSGVFPTNETDISWHIALDASAPSFCAAPRPSPLPCISNTQRQQRGELRERSDSYQSRSILAKGRLWTSRFAARGEAGLQSTVIPDVEDQASGAQQDARTSTRCRRRGLGCNDGCPIGASRAKPLSTKARYCQGVEGILIPITMLSKGLHAKPLRGVPRRTLPFYRIALHCRAFEDRGW